jgi:response regulator RpfG family c-di-GMP phosphodiesterase
MAASQKILLVDDDKLILDAISQILIKEGFEIKTASDGNTAKSLCGLETYTLVISDVKMPGLNGIELLHFLKREMPSIPVILTTGFSEIGSAQEAMELGASGFLPKPFKKADLMALIQSLTAVLVTDTPVEDVDEDLKFCGIPIEGFISGNEIKYDIYIRIAKNKFIKVASNGQTIDLERMNAYRLKGLTHLFLTKQDFAQYVGFSITLASTVAHSAKVEHTKKVRYLMQTTSNILNHLHTEEMDRQSFEMSQSIVQTTVELMGENPATLTILESLKNYTDFLYSHSLGVSLFGSLMAKEMGWSSVKTQTKIAMAGLLHDIGKKEISLELLQKPRIALSQEEVQTLETHVVRGNTLLNGIDGIPAEVSQACLQHHEDCSGLGYPLHLTKNKIIPIARLIYVADLFCNLSLKSPTCPGASPKEALTKMIHTHGKRLDPDYLTALLKVFRMKEKDIQ